MKVKALLFLSLFSILISCSKQGNLNQFETFGEENRWQKSDIKTFEFYITDDSQLYNLTFRFSHVYDYQFANIPINFIIENPAGKKTNHSIDLAIKDDNGQELGECAGDICDLNYKMEQNLKLQKGKYKVTFSHRFNGPYLPNVIGIGLKVEPSK